MPNTSPKVFISHASEDKQRFVIQFATQLRAHGINAWVDKWEMLPGDSLVDKIFEEGLKEAAAVIIVLSKASVLKPWVREELNSAVVTRIQKGTKIIPIVLEECEVPEALKSLVWEVVKDVNDFSDCLSRVVDSVFGHSNKPPIGSPPSYVQRNPLPRINGLTHADNFTLQVIYENFLENGKTYISGEAILSAVGSEGLTPSLISESLEILEHHGYIEQLKHLGPGPYHSRIRTYGISKILGDNESTLIQKVGFCLTNDEMTDCNEIAEAINVVFPLVDHAIQRLEGQGFVKAVRALGGVTYVHYVSPTLRRALSQ